MKKISSLRTVKDIVITPPIGVARGGPEAHTPKFLENSHFGP